MHKMRPAITLLITLSVIAIMISLMGVMFKYLDSAREKAEIKASMIQSNILSADIVQFLKQILGKNPSKSRMKTLFETPLAVNAQNREFNMGVSCQPLADRVNISWLGLENSSKFQKQFSLASSLFDMLTDGVNLRDQQLLKDKITEAIAQRQITVFGEKSRLNKKKGIITFKMFQQILDDYRFETDDERIYGIKWDKYFVFGTNVRKIDGDFISPELLAFLYDVEISIVRENYEVGELNAFLSEIGESRDPYDWLFFKKTQAMAQCRASYSFRKGSYGFTFNYTNGRVEGFEFFDNK